MASEPTPERAAVLVLLVVVFLSLNSSLNLFNRWSLGMCGFRFPILLTSCHMAFSFVALAPVALLLPWESHRQTLKKQWRGIVYVGSFLALSIALNNTSLLDISLTLNQIIRSSIPVVTCLLAIVVESKRPTRQELAALVLLTLGVMLAVWQGTVSGRPYAIICCLIATICSGAMLTFSSKLLSEKLDVVRLAFYTAPVSLACLAPFYWAYETLNFMIKKVSAVTTTVLGEVKIVALLVLSATVLAESKEFTLKMTLGAVLAMLGFALYSYAQIQKLRQTPECTVPNQKFILQDKASGGDDELMPLQARHQSPEKPSPVINSNSAALLPRSDV